MVSYTFPPNTKIIQRNGTSYVTIQDRTVEFSKHISECYYSEANNYLIFYNNNIYIEIKTPRIPEFEAIFPEFPYVADEHKHNNLINKINNLEQLVISTNNRIDKLVSHFETIMIALGQRKASDDNLDI